MKNTTKLVVLILLPIVLTWAIFAFVKVEPNPFLYTQDTRTGMVVTWAAISLVVIATINFPPYDK